MRRVHVVDIPVLAKEKTLNSSDMQAACGRSISNEEGTGVKTCVECGMEVEELEF